MRITVEEIILLLTISVGAFMEIFDITVANVALPTMMGVFGVDFNEISWVLTSYLIGAALFMPLTGILLRKFGHRRLLVVSIIGFTVFSVLCGCSRTLFEISLLRFFQGIFGANLVSLAQYIMKIHFKERLYELALGGFSLILAVAPIIGIVLGGQILNHLSWPFVFFINFPIGVIVLIGIFLSLKEGTLDPEVKLDYLSIALMFIGIVALQIFLDKGSSLEWFNSLTICLLAYCAIVSLGYFLYRGIRNNSFFINLRLFAKKQFSVAMWFIFVGSGYCITSMFLVSLALQEIYLISPNALSVFYLYSSASLIIAAMVGVTLMRFFDKRWIILFGLCITFIMNLIFMGLSTHFSVLHTITFIALSGVSTMFFILPVLVIALEGLTPYEASDATALTNFIRNLGQSIVPSLITVYLWHTQNTTIRQLADSVQVGHAGYWTWTAKQQAFPILGAYNPVSLSMIHDQIAQQALIISFNHTFLILNVIVIMMMASVFLFSPSKTAGSLAV